MSENKQYGIVSVSNASTLDYSELLTDSDSTARANDQNGLQATQKIVGWDLNVYPTIPPTLSGKLETVNGRTTHNHQQIDDIIKTDLNWQNPENV